MAKIKERIPTMAEIDEQIAAARKRDASERQAGLRAQRAWYDPASEHLMIAMTNGVLVGLPLRRIRYLAHAAVGEIQMVKVNPTGTGLDWDMLDVHLSVEGLLEEMFSATVFAEAFGRKGGRSTSAAKTKAARANGAKGGRPPKTKAA